MANNNNRDVSLTLSVETLGAENIKKLQTTVSNLAKEGGEAAPEFQKLADEIGRLGEQANVLKAFTDLSNQTAELSQKQEAAATQAADLSAKLEALARATTKATADQKQAAAALDAAKAAARATRDELQTLTATTDRAGKAEADYATKVQQLKVAKIAQRAEIERLSSELARSNAEVKKADQAESALANTYNRSESAAQKAAKAVRENAAAMQAAAEAALDLGVVTDNVATAQAEIVQDLNRAGRAAGDLQTQIQRLAASERELAGIRAFEKKAAEAAELQRAADYLNFFENSLREVAEAERALEQQQADERWQREAEAIVDAAHAAQELARQTRVLEEAQRELAAQRAFEQQVEDARRLREAADYVREWERQLAEAERQARATADAAEAASRAISDAFRNVGVRSAAELEGQIDQVRNSMNVLRTTGNLTGNQLQEAMRGGANRIRDLERELRRVNGQLTLADQAADLLRGSLGQITAGNLIADGIGFLVNKVKELGVEFVKTLVSTQQLRKGLQAIYGDAEIARAQFDFLKKSATNAGVAVGELQPAFLKFSAATKSSGIPLAQTNELFAQLTRSSAALGVSSEGVTGALEALGQMASKGTVSMEELRQQLGDRLPGALSLVAKGVGITEAQLVKLVENGGLRAEDLFDALTKSLQGVQGSTEGLLPEYNKLKNVLTGAAQAAGDSIWVSVLTSGLQALTFVAKQVAKIFADIFEGVGLIGKGIALLMPGLGSLKDRMKLFGEEVEAAGERQNKLHAALDGTTDGAKKTEAEVDKLGKTVTATALKSAEATVSIISTTVALEAQAEAARLAANGNTTQALSLIQLKLYLDALLATQKEEVEASSKLAKAAKIQGDALVALTELRGQDFLSMQAQAEASQKYAAALGKVEAAQRAETELLVLKRDEVIRVRIAEGERIEQYKDEVAAINLKIVASAAETEQTKQTAAAGRQAALERSLAIRTYQDNSKAINEFRLALESAEANLVAFRSEQEAGRKTDEQVLVARRRVAEATHLLNDALRDSIGVIDLESRAKQANITVTQAKLTVEQNHYEVLAQAARLSGDYAAAVYYEIEAKRKQIEILKLTIQAKRLEAEASIQALEIERSMLDLSDPLLKQKQIEIDIRLANAKAKLIEADASKAQITALEKEIQALQNVTFAVSTDTDARGENTGAIYRQTGAMREQIQVLGEFKDAQDLASRGQQGDSVLNADGTRTFKNAGGQLSSTGKMGGYTISAEQNRLDSFLRGESQIEEGDAEFIQANYDRALANMEVNQRAPAGSVSFDGINSGMKRFNEARIALDALKARRSGGGTGGGFAGVTVGGNGTAGGFVKEAPARAGATQTVNINIAGRTTPVNVASQDDANALTSVLRQLETAAGATRP